MVPDAEPPSLTPEQVNHAWRMIREDAERLRARADDEHGWRISTGSRLDQDDRKSAPFQLSHAAQALLFTSSDHLHGLCALLFDAELIHVHSAASLARASIESAAGVVWLLSSEDPKERLMRLVRWRRQDLEDRKRAFRTMRLDDPGADWHQQRLDQLVSDRGLDPHEARRQVASTALLKAADELDTQYPLSPLAMWQVGSGFAHGRQWPLLALAHREERDGSSPEVVNVRFTMSLERLLPIGWAAHSALTAAVELYTRRGAKPVPPKVRRPR